MGLLLADVVLKAGCRGPWNVRHRAACNASVTRRADGFFTQNEADRRGATAVALCPKCHWPPSAIGPLLKNSARANRRAGRRLMRAHFCLILSPFGESLRRQHDARAQTGRMGPGGEI